MRTIISALALASTVAVVDTGCVTTSSGPAAPTPVRHKDAASTALQLFFDTLAPYGQWWAHPHYGWVWTPDVAVKDWRPYTEGRWVTTSAGATYDADVPWAWAVYHYGRWVETDLGWSWIPGATWSPGFVAWQSDDAGTRWAPLGPDEKPADAWTTLAAKSLASLPHVALRTAPRPRHLKNAFVAVKPPEVAAARVDLLGWRAFLDPADEAAQPVRRIIRGGRLPRPVDVSPGARSASERDETTGTPHG